MATKYNKNQMKKEYKIAPEVNGYEEKYNDVMLNDITFEELKRKEDKKVLRKKKFGFKKKKRTNNLSKYSKNNPEKDFSSHENHKDKKDTNSNNLLKNKKSLSKKLFAKKKLDKSRKNSTINEVPIEDINYEEESLKRSDGVDVGNCDNLGKDNEKENNDDIVWSEDKFPKNK